MNQNTGEAREVNANMSTNGHNNLDLLQLNLDVVRRKAGGKILWQPRIGAWYRDRVFRGEELPQPFTGMDVPGIYRELGCSHRLYNFFNLCIKRVNDHRVRAYSNKIDETLTEEVIETPVGKARKTVRSSVSSPGTRPVKWWVTQEEDFKVFQWLEEHCTWEFDYGLYEKNLGIYGDLGAPTVYLPRVSVQHLYIDLMGVEAGVFALADYPATVEKYFTALYESHERLIGVINKCPVEIINFGDNVHCGTLPPDLFKKYVQPEYIKRNELLHKAGKFTHAHWDGDVKALLPYTTRCGFDGIEALTPKPQGDVTLREIRGYFDEKLFLIDGISALLFEDSYPLEELEKQAREAIELFAPNLILGISDEISSSGNLERIRFVGDIVDKYNNSLKS